MIGRAIFTSLILFLLLCPYVSAQNLEAGLHGGLAVVGNQDYVPHGTETNTEYGIWVIFWPDERISVAADWAIVPQDDFTAMVNGSLVGEEDRNRQFVDITLQYHFWRSENQTIFAEIGGGSYWNNRNVLNPDGIAEFEEEGKESSRYGMWTVGGGFRRRLVPHLNWISQAKLHNPGLRDGYGFRLLTGLTISWK